MAELEKCPFCGGEAEWGTVLKTWIVCKNCGFETPYSQDTEETIRLWNNRTANKKIRNKAIDDAKETVAKAICVGCGYLDGYKCNYKGANCGVSKPMLESVVKALEQMKGGAIDG